MVKQSFKRAAIIGTASGLLVALAGLLVADASANPPNPVKPTVKTLALDAGEPPLAYDQSLTTFRMGENGVLVPYYTMMPVITPTDGGWMAYNIVPTLDGGLQMAGCQLEVKTTRGTICCHALTCTEDECRFTRCERAQ